MSLFSLVAFRFLKKDERILLHPAPCSLQLIFHLLTWLYPPPPSLCLVVPLSHVRTHIPQTLVHKHTQKPHHECTHTQTRASRHTDRVSLSPAATASLFLLLLYCPPIKTLWACKMGLGRTSHLVTFLTKLNPHYLFEMSPGVGC